MFDAVLLVPDAVPEKEMLCLLDAVLHHVVGEPDAAPQ